MKNIANYKFNYVYEQKKIGYFLGSAFEHV